MLPQLVHLCLAASGAVPLKQGVQTLLPELLTCPGAHGRHASCLASGKEPASHGEHVVAVDGRTLPPLHRMHWERVAASGIVPGSHSAHRVPLDTAEAVQVTHAVRVVPGMVPLLHGVQCDMPRTALTVPCRHGTHAPRCALGVALA